MRFRLFLYWCLFFALFLLSGWGLFYHQVVCSRDIRVETQEFSFPQWPADSPSVRAVVLADPHLAFWEGEKLERIVRTITELKPDLILLPGDFPYGVSTRFSLPEEECCEKLAPLASAAPVCYITGNHDVHFRSMKSEFKRLGFLRCCETTRRLHLRNGRELDIIGFTRSYGGTLNRDLPKNIAAAGEVPLLGIAHYPDSFYRHPLPQVDLVVAGHTHGGQLCDSTGMPLRGLGSLTREQTRGGLHTRPDGKPLYITRGIGMSRLPIRLNCPAEITLLLLKGSLSRPE